MAVQLNIIQVQENDDSVTLVAKLTFSGNYVNPTGDNIDFTTIIGASAAGGPGVAALNTSKNPRQFLASAPALQGTISRGSGAGGYDITFVPGNALNANAVFVWTAAGTQLGSGAYPAAITGDTQITLTATFDKLL